MRFFEVTITREISVSAQINVQARSLESAMKRAKEMVDADGGRSFRECDVLDEDIKAREIGGGK